MPPAADLLRAALAAAPGPHPAADTLRQYAAGTLAPAQQHQVEAHALDCEQCADALAGLAQTDAAATDQALAALRTRLHARVAAEARPAAGARHWPRLAAAAAVVAGLVGGGLWERQHLAPRAPEVAAVAPPGPAPRPAPSPLASARVAPVLPAPVAVAPPAKVQPARAAPAVAALSRPAPPVAYEAYDRSRKANAAPPRAAPPPSAAAPGGATDDRAAAVPVATISRALAATPDSTASAEQAPTFAKGLTGRAAAGAVAMSERAIPAPAARKMARALPPNSAVPGPMPAVPGLAPAPVGGLAALRETLRRQAAGFVPEAAPPLHGPVRVRFVVGDDGKISDLKVVRGLRPDYDAEALRLLGEGPGWVPGTAAGRRAALPVELDVVF